MAQNSPETWLQSELSALLVTIHDVLDAWARLPFDCPWTRKPPADHYLLMLKGMEEQLLRMWVRMQRKQWNVLVSEVLAWNGTQKRMPNGVLRNYYSCLQSISLYVSEDEELNQAFPKTWSGFLIRSICSEHYLLKRCAELEDEFVSEELQNLCGNYLKCMQVLHQVEPRELCSSFFTLLSPFTRESVFLTDYPSLSPGNLSSTEISSFAGDLLSSKDWQSKTKDYLQLLRKNS